MSVTAPWPSSNSATEGKIPCYNKINAMQAVLAGQIFLFL